MVDVGGRWWRLIEHGGGLWSSSHKKRSRVINKRDDLLIYNFPMRIIAKDDQLDSVAGKNIVKIVAGVILIPSTMKRVEQMM